MLSGAQPSSGPDGEADGANDVDGVTVGCKEVVGRRVGTNTVGEDEGEKVGVNDGC